MKLRKMLAVSMATMVATASLAACGSKDEEKSKEKETKVNSFKTSMEEGAKIENAEYKTEMSFSVTGGDMDIDEETKKMFGIKGDTLDMEVSFAGQKAGDNMSSTVGLKLGELKTDFIEVMYVDGDAYLNLEMLSDSVEKIVSDLAEQDISEQFDKMMPKGKYIEITKEQLSELFEKAVGMNFEAYMNMLKESANSKESKEAEEMVKFFVELLDKAAKKADLYKKAGDKYSLSINKGNLNEILDAIVEIVEKEGEEIAKKINKFSGEQTVTANDIKSVVSMLSIYDVEQMIGDEMDFDFTISSEYAENKWAVGLSASLEAQGNAVEVELSYEAVEKKNLEIKAPKDLVDEKIANELVDSVIKGIEKSTGSSNGLDTDINFNDFNL